jgi:hypothetical protein
MPLVLNTLIIGLVLALPGQSAPAPVCFWRFLTPPPDRRTHPAGRRTALGLPDESGVPIGIAARLGGGVSMRPCFVLCSFGLAALRISEILSAAIAGGSNLLRLTRISSTENQSSLSCSRQDGSSG